MQVTGASQVHNDPQPQEQGSRQDDLLFLQETIAMIKKKQASSPQWVDTHYVNNVLQYDESVLEYMQKNPKATLADAYIAKGMESYEQQLDHVSWLTPKARERLLENGRKQLEETAQDPNKLREQFQLNLPPPMHY